MIIVLKENIKVIFLDIDGVLNSYDWRKKNRDTAKEIKCLDDKAIKVLDEIVKKSGAKIVLSSSWRRSPNSWFTQILKEKFEKYGLSLFGETGFSTKKLPRGWEIRQWMKDNKKKYNIQSFVILDDDANDIINHKKTLLPYFVKTSFKDGLTKQHIPLVIHVLNGGKLKLKFLAKKTDPEDTFWFRKHVQETIDD